jgi:hypothetical protein
MHERTCVASCVGILLKTFLILFGEETYMMWADTFSKLATFSRTLISAEIMLSYKQSKLRKKFSIILENMYSLALKIMAF